MSTINDGGPAFPQYLPAEQSRKGSHGMSLRDYFAAQALAGAHYKVEDLERVGRLCYQMADAMLAARKA